MGSKGLVLAEVAVGKNPHNCECLKKLSKHLKKNQKQMVKILIMGLPGSGKTTLSKELGKKIKGYRLNR